MARMGISRSDSGSGSDSGRGAERRNPDGLSGHMNRHSSSTADLAAQMRHMNIGAAPATTGGGSGGSGGGGYASDSSASSASSDAAIAYAMTGGASGGYLMDAEGLENIVRSGFPKEGFKPHEFHNLVKSAEAVYGQGALEKASTDYMSTEKLKKYQKKKRPTNIEEQKMVMTVIRDCLTADKFKEFITGPESNAAEFTPQVFQNIAGNALKHIREGTLLGYLSERQNNILKRCSEQPMQADSALQKGMIGLIKKCYAVDMFQDAMERETGNYNPSELQLIAKGAVSYMQKQDDTGALEEPQTRFIVGVSQGTVCDPSTLIEIMKRGLWDTEEAGVEEGADKNTILNSFQGQVESFFDSDEMQKMRARGIVSDNGYNRLKNIVEQGVGTLDLDTKDSWLKYISSCQRKYYNSLR